jgi:FkbM family methyltransferase
MESLILKKEYRLLGHFFSNRHPTLIVDAGAHIGLFSIFALSIWPSAKIFSVEASPETYMILRLNQEKNSDYSWHIYQYALWDKNEDVDFESNGLNSGWHISNKSTDTRVHAIRLDSFMNQYLPKEPRISLLKLDIEGSEEAVLLDSQHILDKVESVLIEIHPPTSNKSTVIAILKAKFSYLYEISEPDNKYPLLLASGWQFPGNNSLLAL